ncbi:alkaline phosphatase D family protein [Pontibacter vulgaris]|uniref:alkaline phosphatase D family protein n=1 Tax=Pontibacter vulgaris TaxID=2905679 RepID=UPI001FA79B2B|nr:alkaline phosphatase D family protein [Pontibacter vulgaris]
MNRITLYLLLPIIGLFLSASLSGFISEAPKKDHTRIAFGSCNNQNEAQPLWPSVLESDPDLWLWLGDNIYADTQDTARLRSMYQQQLQNSGYSKLLKKVPVTGIWDDHDFGYDNAGKESAIKVYSQQLFLDFMNVPKDDSVRTQQGIYRTYTLGKGDKKVKILLLDVRYFRDKLKTMQGLYLRNNTGDVLGEAQWKWLEKELTNSDARVHIIASGLQILPTGMVYTNWSAFPGARKRLLTLLEKTKPAIPVLLSGDRHVGELSKIELKGYTSPVYEITSSGMTHFRQPKKSGNIFRVGEQIGALNFGVLDIEWEKDKTILTMQVKGLENKTLLEKKIEYDKEQQAL